MAFIVASQIVEDATQVDGRRHIVERHTETDGTIHEFRWTAEVGQDATAGLAARATYIDSKLPEVESERLVNAIADDEEIPARKYATPAAVLRALRNRLREAEPFQIARLARFLLTRSDAELRAVFSIEQAAVAALRERLRAKKDAYDAAMAVEGE